MSHRVGVDSAPAANGPTDNAPADGAWLVVGLGNPGPSYAGNRHNIGQRVAEELADRVGSAFRRHKSGPAVAQGRLGVLAGGAPGPSVVLANPTAYMNVSGGQVAGLRRFFGIEPDRLLVVHDELDVPFGSVRLKRGGGEGGHNGLRSISQSVGTRDYLRVRVGIGRPPGRMDAADFVLRDFGPTERKELSLLVDEAADAVECVILRGLLPAQQRFHAPPT